jgi:hypothetical protein
MGKEVLSRRIQVISDLVALCGLREPSRRGPKMDKIDRSQFEEPIDLDDLGGSSTNRSTDEAKSSDSSHTDELAFPTDQYIFCTGDVTLCAFIRERNSEPTHSGVMWRISISFYSPGQTLCPVVIAICSDTGVPPFLNREVNRWTGLSIHIVHPFQTLERQSIYGDVSQITFHMLILTALRSGGLAP